MGDRRTVQAFIVIRLRREISMQKRLVALFKDMGEEMLRVFPDQLLPGVIGVINRSKTPLQDLLITNNSLTAAAAGSLQFEKLVNQKALTVEYLVKQFEDELQQDTFNFISENGINSSNFISDTQKGVASSIVQQGIAEGIASEAIGRRLLNWFGGIPALFHASRIARTETGIAGSHGQHIGARRAGIPLRKEWVAVTGDGRTRDAHIGVNTTVVDMNAKFIVGGERMLHPHDQSASLGNIINCRCVINYIPQGI